MSVPTPMVELALAATPFGTWAWDAGDISEYVRQAITIRRGRRSVFTDCETGWARVTIDNRSRLFDPENTSSIHADEIYPMLPIRIRAIWDETLYPLFQGFVVDWRPRYLKGEIAYLDLICVDGFEPLARLPLGSAATPLVLAQAAVDQRIIDTLDAAGWPGSGHGVALGGTGPRWIDDTSALEIQASTLVSSPALEHLQAVVRSVDGVFFIDHEGQATFQDRSYRDGLSSVGTFSDKPDGSELPYAGPGGLQTSYGASQIFNRVEWQNQALAGETRAEIVAEDATSVAKNLTRLLPRTSMLLDDDGDAQTIADQLLGRFKDPKVRAERIEIDPAVRPATTWPVVLAADISTRLDIHRQGVNGGSELELTGFVEGIDWGFQFDREGQIGVSVGWDISTL